MNCLKKRATNLIIGSNSYLGINLSRFILNQDTILSSMNSNDNLNSEFEFIQENIEYGIDQLKNIYVENLFILARPIYQDSERLAAFYDNLKRLVAQYLNLNDKLAIHFISSSLVYNSDENNHLDENSELDLRQNYELYKWEFEQFLSNIAPGFSSASINIHRLPLLIGGLVRPRDSTLQLFYRWYTEFNTGYWWQFNESELAREYGTSWLNVDSFSKWLTTKTFKSGRNLWLPKSGNISYFSFHQQCRAKLIYRPIRGKRQFPRSFLYLKENAGIEQESFWNVFNP